MHRYRYIGHLCIILHIQQPILDCGKVPTNSPSRPHHFRQIASMGVWPAAVYFDWVARYVPRFFEDLGTVFLPTTLAPGFFGMCKNHMLGDVGQDDDRKKNNP